MIPRPPEKGAKAVGRVKFECGKCGEEFDAQMYVKCPKCGEIKDVHPVSHYHR